MRKTLSKEGQDNIDQSQNHDLRKTKLNPAEEKRPSFASMNEKVEGERNLKKNKSK